MANADRWRLTGRAERIDHAEAVGQSPSDKAVRDLRKDSGC